MADRRCLRKEILFSDQFLNMPPKICLLYILLNYMADDDGFVSNPGVVLRACRCKEKDMKLLFDEGYLYGFPSGVILIRHWSLHNTIKGDRYHPTMYTDELAQVEKDSFKIYQLKKERSSDHDSRRSSPGGRCGTAADDGEITSPG